MNNPEIYKDTSVDKIHWGERDTRIKKIFKNANLHTVQDVLEYGVEALGRLKDCGRSSVFYIKKTLSSLGISCPQVTDNSLNCKTCLNKMCSEDIRKKKHIDLGDGVVVDVCPEIHNLIKVLLDISSYGGGLYTIKKTRRPW